MKKLISLINKNIYLSQKPKKEGKFSFPTKLKPLGFTLVELIVVITILSILGTISFVSFNNYAKGARDSTRISDLSSISKGLGIYQAKVGRYPLPDKSVKIYGSGELCGYQGEVGTTIANIINLSSIGGKDPLYQSNYTYNTNAGFDKYQMLTFLEDRTSIVLDFQPSQNLTTTYATEYMSKFPYVRGDLLGIILNYSTGSKNEPIYTPLQDTSTGIILESPLANQKVITASDIATITGVTINIKPNYIKPVPVNGVCGTKSKTYQTSDTAFVGGDTDCTAGSLSGTVTWPIAGATTTWYCNGFNGGTNATCAAVHTNNSCATNPVFANVGILTTNPTSVGQAWVYSTTPTGSCTYTCLNGYSGNNCATPPTYQSLGLCNSPDITVGSYTIAACNIGTTTAGTTSASYGRYFQWGEMYGWDSTAGTTSVNNVKYANGIATSGNLSSWPATVFDNVAGGSDRWGLNPIQGPCPSGRHVPNISEWSGMIADGGYGANGSIMSTVLKLPMAGYRSAIGGGIVNQTTNGVYWSSSSNLSFDSHVMNFESSFSITLNTDGRTYGLNVRCFKN